MMTMNQITKRRVEVTLGKPDVVASMPLEPAPGMPHYTECYFITFLEPFPEQADEGADGFTVQTTCLCTLSVAVIAWLQGESAETVKTAMDGHADYDDADGADN